MKVALFAANRGYGLYSSRRRIISSLLERGWRVVLATADDEYSAKLVAAGAELVPVLFQRGSSGLASDLRAFLRLRRLCRSLQPDLVHLFNAKPVILGALACRWAGQGPGHGSGRGPGPGRRQVVATITGLGHAFIAGGLVRWFAGLGYRLALARVDHVVFQNRDDQQLFVARGWLGRTAHSLIVGSGVDVEQFVPAATAGDVAASSPVRVLMVARLLWQKGVAEFLAAAALVQQQCPDVLMSLAGELDPGHPDAVPAVVLEQASGVRYLGYVSDMPALLADADIAVLPSYREGVPRVLLEAMASGLPCVAADVPGCREVVAHGVTGLLVPVRDAGALAAAICTMAADPQLRRRLGMAGRQRAEQEFDLAVVCARHLALYEQLALSGQQATP